MADTSALHESLSTIAERTIEDMSERDVENLFLEQGFYDALGYEGTGTDIRSEFTRAGWPLVGFKHLRASFSARRPTRGRIMGAAGFEPRSFRSAPFPDSNPSGTLLTPRVRSSHRSGRCRI